MRKGRKCWLLALHPCPQSSLSCHWISLQNGRKRVENTVEKGQIAPYEQFLLIPLFSKVCGKNARGKIAIGKNVRGKIAIGKNVRAKVVKIP